MTLKSTSVWRAHCTDLHKELKDVPNFDITGLDFAADKIDKETYSNPWLSDSHGSSEAGFRIATYCPRTLKQ